MSVSWVNGLNENINIYEILKCKAHPLCNWREEVIYYNKTFIQIQVFFFLLNVHFGSKEHTSGDEQCDRVIGFR